MSRLTTKIEDGFYVADHAHNTDEVTHKLGKLEDLEEELGCPLEIVFKALKNGIYTKDLPREELSKQFVRLSNVETEWYLSNNIMCVNLKDYKTLFWTKGDKSE